MRLFSNVSARRVGAVATALLMAVAGLLWTEVLRPRLM